MRSVTEMLGISSTARMLERVQATATQFLRAREIVNFDLHAIMHAGRPTILVFADAQRRLRYSNILEEMLRRYVAEQCPDLEGAEGLVVFWRYRLSTDVRQIAGPIAELEDFSEQMAAVGEDLEALDFSADLDAHLGALPRESAKPIPGTG